MSAYDHVVALSKKSKEEETGLKDKVIVLNHVQYIGPCTQAHADREVLRLKREDKTNIIRVIELYPPNKAFDFAKGMK